MINVNVWMLRPERPTCSAKSLHDIRVRWHAGRDRWFELAATRAVEATSPTMAVARSALGMFRSRELVLLSTLVRRELAPGDVIEIGGNAYCFLGASRLRRIDGLVAPASDPAAAKDARVML